MIRRQSMSPAKAHFARRNPWPSNRSKDRVRRLAALNRKPIREPLHERETNNAVRR